MKSPIAMFFSAFILSGCVLAPPPVVQVAPVPAGVTYIGPNYPLPGPGYAWQYHPQNGWGWFHPRFGWHRGWR